MELSCEYTNAFQEMLERREPMVRFRNLLFEFLQGNFPSIYPVTPTKVDFSLFQDPDLDFPEPRIEIHVPIVANITRSILHERFARGFKAFIASRSRDPADFKELRALQREFIIIFRME